MVGNDDVDGGNDVFVKVVEKGQQEAQGAQEDLQEKAFGKRVTGIAWAREQLEEGVDERTGVHAPEEGYVLLDGVPSHTSHLGTLTTARTEVVGKLGAAVMTTAGSALVAIDIVGRFLLPAAETVELLL